MCGPRAGRKDSLSGLHRSRKDLERPGAAETPYNLRKLKSQDDREFAVRESVERIRFRVKAAPGTTRKRPDAAKNLVQFTEKSVFDFVTHQYRKFTENLKYFNIPPYPVITGKCGPIVGRKDSISGLR